MEEKLREFKSRRRREILLSKPKMFIKGIAEKFSFKRESPSNPAETQSPLLSEKKCETSRVREDDESSLLSVASTEDSIITLPSMTWLTAATYFLYFLLWVITYLMAIHLEFGFVYLICSGLGFIYFNTRTGPKKEGEISAYSVFNPGCEAIDGTLKAEQFEREFNLIKHDSVSPIK